MYPSDRRLPLTIAAVLAAIVAVVVAFVVGRSSAPEPPPANAVATVRGVTLGTSPTRAGALAAADNYVSTAVDSILSDPAAYERFVRSTFATQSVSKALTDAEELRKSLPNTTAAFADGMKTTTWSAARRLVSYEPTRAEVRTWTGTTTWGGKEKPTQSWAINRTVLVWEAGTWRVQTMDAEPTPAPVPATVQVQGSSDSNEAFKALDGMTAPIYGVG